MYDEIVLSANVLEKLKALREQDALVFKNGVRNFYTAAIKHLLEKSVLQLSLSIVKRFRFLSPHEVKNNRQRNVEDAKEIFQALPLAVPLDGVIDELKLLHGELDCKPKMAKMPMLDFWRNVFHYELPSKDKKYPNLTIFVKAALLVFHGSADIERSLSDSANILTDDKTCMTIELLNIKYQKCVETI